MTSRDTPPQYAYRMLSGLNVVLRTMNGIGALVSSDTMMTASWKSSKRSVHLRDERLAKVITYTNKVKMTWVREFLPNVYMFLMGGSGFEYGLKSRLSWLRFS
jgi:hypothetical protein